MYCTFNNKKINTKDSPFLTNTTKREILFLEKIHFLKSQKRLYFLHQLRKLNLPQELMIQFYSAVVESVLCTSTVWFS